MEIIGFIFSMLFGLYVLATGIFTIIAETGFTGKSGPLGFILAGLGISVVYIVWHYKPFTVTFGG